MAVVTDLIDKSLDITEDLRQVAGLFDRELHDDECPAEVAELCSHIARFRGKMLRPALLLLAARATGGVKPIHLALATVVEMFHVATLVHDDVIDDAQMRRNAPTINHGWGNQAAIMLGDWLSCRAHQLCVRQQSQWASMQVSTTAQRVFHGELVQLILAERGKIVIDPQRYIEIIASKTGALTGLATRIGAHFNDAPAPVEQACLDYGVKLGIAFQIADDVLDLVGEESAVGKTLRSDLAEGKATLPLIHFLHAADEMHAERIRKLLNGHYKPADTMSDGMPQRRRTWNSEFGVPAWQMSVSERQARQQRLDEARRMIIDAGCIESARAVARGYADSAKEHLACLPAGNARDGLAALADFAVGRSG